MHVQRCTGAQLFLDETTTYRANDPIRTNVLGSIAISVIRHPDLYDEYWWWVVRDDAHCVLGAALRTAPHALLLGPMPADAAGLLAHAISEGDDAFPGVNGPEAAVSSFLASYALVDTVGSRRRPMAQRANVVYELRTLTVPEVKGEMITATRQDTKLVERWNDDFHLFVDGASPRASSPRGATLRAKIDTGAVRLWCRRSRPVSMAAHSEPVETPAGLVTRIGPVFTPERRRGHGYGAAVTAGLSDDLLRGGSRVMLYADAANPTSNGVYQRLGFERLDAVVQFSLDGPRVH